MQLILRLFHHFFSVHLDLASKEKITLLLNYQRPLSSLQSSAGFFLSITFLPMFPWLGLHALLLFFLVAVSPFTAPALAAACEPARCGNVTVFTPFGIVSGSEENPCAQFGFQVHCADGGVPYLGYYELDFSLRILDIFYGNASLIVSDVHKLGDFSNRSAGGCHVPTANTATKIGAPFSISPLNRNLVFYNCTREPGLAARKRAGLLDTVCRNRTFVSAGGRYGQSGGYDLDGCSAIAVPVLGASTGEVNASEYEALISDGFLLTWSTGE